MLALPLKPDGKPKLDADKLHRVSQSQPLFPDADGKRRLLPPDADGKRRRQPPDADSKL